MKNDGPPEPLIEASLADVLAWLSADPDLEDEQRRQSMCSLRMIAKAIGRPPELLPARLTAIAQPMARLHHMQMGVLAKTLANHKANVRAALKRFANEKDLPSRGVALAPEWERLRSGISHFRDRAILSSLMRYCSGNSISPEAVDASVLDSLMHYRAASTALAADSAARRKIARAWNSCIGVVPGWPLHRLLEPPVKSGLVGPAWE
jgi:hypothetical protein